MSSPKASATERYKGMLRVSAIIYDTELAKIIMAHSACKGERAKLVRQALKEHFQRKGGRP